MNTYLEFEKPIEQLDNKVHELKSLNDNAPSDNLLEEITPVSYTHLTLPTTPYV